MISASHLSKSFGPFKAVDDVSLNVSAGEVLGFLGPNGAGKTTTMRLITGYLEPDEGEVKINNISLAEDPLTAKSLIGYLPENAPVYRDMNVKNFLHFIAGLRGLTGKKKSEAIDNAVSICHLDSVFYQSIDTLSKGYIRRCAFAQAIIHDPPILILDEPTDGLDPNQKFEVRQMIKQMGQKKAIIISTHILEEVEACCTRALIISDGKIVANGTPEELKSKALTANTLLLSLYLENSQEQQNLKDSLSAFENVEKIIELPPANNCFSLRIFPKKNIKPAQLLLEIASYLQNKKINIENLKIDDGRLDEVFRSITKNEVNLK